MKYIIKESQVKNLMWKYFDSPVYNVKKTPHYLFLENNHDNRAWVYKIYNNLKIKFRCQNFTVKHKYNKALNLIM